MKKIDKHGNEVTMQGDRNGIVTGSMRFIHNPDEAFKDGVKLYAAEKEKEFIGQNFRFAGQAETLPADLYDNIANFDPRWRPYILDFTRTIAMRERVFSPIYETIESADFDERMATRDFTGSNSFVYTEWQDGEEVWTNRLKPTQAKDSVTMKIHAGAYERTLRDQLFNKLWKQEILARAQGEGYIDFLNHLYMYPIIGASYTGKSVAVASLKNKASNTWWEQNWQIMKLAKDMYFTAKDDHKQYLDLPVLVMNKKTYMTAFMDTLDAIEFADGKRYTSMRNWWGQIVIYDGAEVEFGDRVVSYASVSDNEVIMVSPKRGFKELVKQPLTMVTKPGTELALDRKIWWDCRGIIADPTQYAYKFTLVPASDTSYGLKST